MDQLFPDEIFLEIFRYTEAVDLFRGFCNLNARLNRIIAEVRVRFSSELTQEERQHVLPHLHPKQIRSFYIGAKEYQYPYLSECSNIRELTFARESAYNAYRISHPELAVVQPSNFSHLRNLTIYRQSWTFDLQTLCTMIFGNQFLFLESAHLPYANSNCIRGLKTWSTSLTRVWIECCTMSMLYPLLDNLSNLEFFSCTLCTKTRGSLKNQCLALKYFDLTNYDRDKPSPTAFLSMSEIENLFRHFPNLEIISLGLADSVTSDEALRSLNAVLSHCPKLKCVDCFIKYTGLEYSATDFDQVKNQFPLLRDFSTVSWEEFTFRYHCHITKG